MAARAEARTTQGVAERRSRERRLAERRSVRRSLSIGSSPVGDITGFQALAADGPAGRVEELCCEHDSLIVTDLVVVMRRVLVSRRIFVPVSMIERVDMRRRAVYLRYTRAQMLRL